MASKTTFINEAQGGGQFTPESGGQFAPDLGGQVRPESGGQFERIFQLYKASGSKQSNLAVWFCVLTLTSCRP
jgi:hypothetical protein